MSQPSAFTPLASIDAVVIDTETTGLDARIARIVQLGGIGLTAGVIDRANGFDQLVYPGIPIPPQSTSIHGISDHDVTGKPSFAQVAAAFADFMHDRIVIGHSLDYDFAILQEEYRLAGASWRQPHALDVRVLAQLVSPRLQDHSLDRLCEWLGVEMTARHTAMGDALATAEVYLRLVPHLRHRGIRTFAEAKAAVAAVTERDARTARGLLVVDTPAAFRAPVFFILDSFAYRQRVSDVMSSPPVIMLGSDPVSDGIKLMLEKGISSVLVMFAGGKQQGIVTERDALRAVHQWGADALSKPLADIAKSPLHTAEEDDHAYRAIGRMERLKIRHLAVRNVTGDIVGMLTPRNLLRNRATTAIALGDGTAAAQSAEQLASMWAQVPPMAAALLSDDVDARIIAGVVSAEICAMTGRAAELAEAQMLRSGQGHAPVPYACLVLGSAGRGESLLAADQDNALIFESGDPGGPEDAWFEQMAVHMTSILDQAGIPFCKGAVMAKSSQWRHSLRGWHELVESWVKRQQQQDLLNVDIFFDAVIVHGDRRLSDNLLSKACQIARETPDFLMMMTELARQWSSPFGLLGGFKKENGRIDLKKHGLLPIFTAARVLSLRHGINQRSTSERLKGILARGVGSQENIERVLTAHEVLLRAVLEQQIEDGQRGITLSPRVDIERLDKNARRKLKDAIQAISEIIGLVAEGRL